MKAIDHYREGARLLAESQRTSAFELAAEDIPAYALTVAQARAHFDAARTIIAAVNALDMPAHAYEEWEELVSGPRKRSRTAREFEDVAPCFDCETAGRDCAAHGRPQQAGGGR